MQQLTQQLASSNSSALGQDLNTIQTDSAGGPVPISQNNQRNLKVGGVQTKIPYSDFQDSMQNPQMKQQFANTIANSDMSDASGGTMAANDMNQMMTEMNNKFGIQQFEAQIQSRGVNDLASMVDEVYENIEELNEDREDEF